MDTKLYDGNAAFVVLSHIYKNPDILMDEKFILSLGDFESSPVHQYIYSAMYNLVIGNEVTKLNTEDIQLYISKYPKQSEEFTKQGGPMLLNHMVKRTSDDDGVFKMNYNTVKKLTVLRELKKNGIYLSEFKTDNWSNFEEREKWEQVTVEDIIKKVQEKVNKVENSYISPNASLSQKAAKGIKELYWELKNNPEIGVSLDGDILDYILRGARYGKMYLNSAPSGHGKTRFMVGNACAISLPRIENGKVVMRENLLPVLFVTTEQQADEIQTMLLAYVSGVNEEKILYGTATPREEELILQAADLIKKYEDNFIIEVIPDPSIAIVRAKLVKHIIQNRIQFIFYDYIFSSPGLLGEFRDVKVREDRQKSYVLTQLFH